MEFKQYQRTAPTRARRLTEEDYQRYKGIIQTLEGPQPFLPGDYLATDAKGEWPIKQATIEKNILGLLLMITKDSLFICALGFDLPRKCRSHL